MDWGDLYRVWLFELGSFPEVDGHPHIQFNANSNIITGANISNPLNNAFRSLPSVDRLYITNRNALAGGQFGVNSQTHEYFLYNESAYYGTLANGQTALIFLGSFDTHTTVVSKTSNSAVIHFESVNLSGWESATRFIKVDGVEEHFGIIPNKPRGTGLHIGGNLSQTYQWEDTVLWP